MQVKLLDYGVPSEMQPTEAHIASRPALERVTVEKLFIKEKINQTESLRQALENGAFNDSALITYVYDDWARLAEGVRCRSEAAKMEVLSRLSACWARLAESVRVAVMSAVCAYADQANIEESGGPVSSETNDGISRTYVTGSASSAGASRNAGTAQGRLSNAIRLYLAPTGLLFRGRGRR